VAGVLAGGLGEISACHLVAGSGALTTVRCASWKRDVVEPNTFCSAKYKYIRTIEQDKLFSLL